MAYGKALSTYKRINKIKRSAENISQAQSKINEQRAKSIQEARKLQNKANIVNAVAGVVQTGAAYGMSKSNNITPERASEISAGLGGVAAVGSSLFTPMNQDDFLGLSTEEYRELYQSNQPDIAGGAIEGYSLQESLNEIRRRRDYENTDLSDNPYGFTEDQMAPYMDDIEFERGAGYDFSSLPRVTQEKLRNIQIQRGLINDPLDIDSPDEDFDIMNAFDFIKNNQPNFVS